MSQADGSDEELASDVLEQRLRLLQGISIFFIMPDVQLRRLARKLRPRHVPAGTVVLNQGEVSNHVFIIESGRCEAHSQWAPGHSVTVALLSKGDFFGISAVTPGHVQDASVTATERCDLLELSREALDSVLVEGSSVRDQLARLVEQRRETVRQLVERAQKVSPEHHGMVVAVYSVKGGSGKTTIAVNLAVALGSKQRGECVLLDLALPYNHAALIANLVPSGCVAVCDKVAEDMFDEALLSACLYHPSGALVLPSCLRIEESELITPHLVQRTLDMLERNFTYVVVDLGVALGEVTLNVLERASKVLVVVTPELPTLKDTEDLLEVFETVLKIPTGNVTLLLNHPRPHAMVSREDADRVIGRPMTLEIPYDGGRFDRAGVSGEVLVTAAPSSAPARTLQRLAAQIVEDYRMHVRR